jgi:hypothetical protein
MSCATTTRRRHLISKHLDEWIVACKEAGIKITATGKDVSKALEKFNYTGGDDAISADSPVPVYRAYTPKAFLDAIAKWIIADDQVCLLYYFYFLYLPDQHAIVSQCY